MYSQTNSQWPPKLDLSPYQSPAITPIHSPLQPPPQRIGLTDRTSSSKDVNTLFTQYQHEKCTTQENIQVIQKKDRWSCAVPLRILMKLIDIYDGLLKEFDVKPNEELLANAQVDYEEMLQEVFKEFKGFQKEVCTTREDEFSDRCNIEFDIMLSKGNRNPGTAAIDSNMKELKYKQKMLNRQTVTENLVRLNEIEAMALDAQVDFLKARKAFREAFYEKRALKEEDNPLFHEFKHNQFNGVLFAGSVNAQSHIDPEVVEKAKNVCNNCFQFYPKLICCSEVFSNKIDIDYLEITKVVQLSPVKTNSEIQITKETLQGAKESVQRQLKTWDTLLKTIGKTTVDLVIRSEHYQAELKKLDTQSEKQASGDIFDIWSAVTKGQLSDVKKYHAQMDVNLFDINGLHEIFGRTLLHTAILYKKKEMVQYLLEQGANQVMLTSRLLDGKTFYYAPLHLSAIMCSPELVSLCIKNHQNSSYFSDSFLCTEDLDTPTEPESISEKYTALHLAIKPQLLFSELSAEEFNNWKTHSYSIVKLLLDKGASIHPAECTSSFLFAANEYVAACQQTRMQFSTNKQAPITRDVLGSLIELFLSRTQLSFDQVREGAEKIMNYFNRKRLEPSESLLLQKLIKHAYFATEEGEKFLLPFQDLIKGPAEKPTSNESGTKKLWMQVNNSQMNNSNDTKSPNTPRIISPLTRSNSTPYKTGNSLPSPRTNGNRIISNNTGGKK